MLILFTRRLLKVFAKLKWKEKLLIINLWMRGFVDVTLLCYGRHCFYGEWGNDINWLVISTSVNSILYWKSRIKNGVERLAMHRNTFTLKHLFTFTKVILKRLGWLRIVHYAIFCFDAHWPQWNLGTGRISIKNFYLNCKLTKINKDYKLNFRTV